MQNRISTYFPWFLILTTYVFVLGCDHGLEPPEILGEGVIVANFTYEGRVPPGDSLSDLRFIAMRFVPRDTSDFLRLNEIVFSGPMKPFWVNDALFLTEKVTIERVLEGSYLYNGVAHQYSPSFFDWRPVGLVAENEGLLQVAKDETTFVNVVIDFYDRPIFPPE